jgi:hypothetical protein
MVMMIKNANTGPIGDKGDIVETFEDQLESEIYATAQPRPHTYSLTPVTIDTNSGANSK